MATAFRRATDRPATAVGEARLSGRVMGQLGAAEQLVVWAFREAASGDVAAERRLMQGFRLAFGERGLAAAVCGFDGMRRCLADAAASAGASAGARAGARAGESAPRFCPVRCACLAEDEERLLYALAAAQLGDRATHRQLMQDFVPESLLLQLWRQSRLFGAALMRVDLALQDRRLVEHAGAVTCH